MRGLFGCHVRHKMVYWRHGLNQSDRYQHQYHRVKEQILVSERVKKFFTESKHTRKNYNIH